MVQAFLTGILAISLLEAPGYESPLLKAPDIDGDGISNDLHWSKENRTISIIVSQGARSWLPEIVKATKTLSMFSSPVHGTEREEVYEYSPPPTTVVYVTVDSEGVLRGRGSTMVYYFPDGEIISATVSLPSYCRPEQRQGVLIHELLHVLGLDHSDDPANIMFRLNGTRQTLDADQKKFLEDFRRPFFTKARP